jgi:hypothetical protein
MADIIPDKKSCPYWSPISLKCSLCNEGLFIPLENHIEIYCRTEAYTMCMQYSLSSEFYRPSLAENTAAPRDNRRRHIRMEDRQRVTLVQLNRSETVASHVSTPARTIDLSLGGLRLQTAEPLVNDTVIRFSFDDLAPDFPLAGTAIVKWCHRLIDSPEYQAGLAFSNEQTAEAMGMYLGTRHFLR